MGHPHTALILTHDLDSADHPAGHHGSLHIENFSAVWASIKLFPQTIAALRTHELATALSLDSFPCNVWANHTEEIFIDFAVHWDWKSFLILYKSLIEIFICNIFKVLSMIDFPYHRGAAPLAFRPTGLYCLKASTKYFSVIWFAWGLSFLHNLAAKWHNPAKSAPVYPSLSAAIVSRLMLAGSFIFWVWICIIFSRSSVDNSLRAISYSKRWNLWREGSNFYGYLVVPNTTIFPLPTLSN